jgi:hypothetical protein
LHVVNSLTREISSLFRHQSKCDIDHTDKTALLALIRPSYSTSLKLQESGDEGCGVLMLARHERRLSLDVRKLSSCCCRGLVSISVTTARRSGWTPRASRSEKMLCMNPVSYTSPLPEVACCRAQRSTWATTASVTALSRTNAKVATMANRSLDSLDEWMSSSWVDSVDFRPKRASLRVMADVLDFKTLDAIKCCINVAGFEVLLSSWGSSLTLTASFGLKSNASSYVRLKCCLSAGPVRAELGDRESDRRDS